MDKIDFVITWVDGNDPLWQKERNHYALLENKEVDNRNALYRDWGTLRYWFRGVEKFAPWVNNIFFITCGHLPEWLNENHPKLKIVNHSEYIPKEYLPTFNSNVIEFYFHKIKGLSNNFVYFNDDMFLLNSVKPERFFRDGLPCDLAAMRTIINRGMFGTSIYSANMLINEHFNKRESIKKNLPKWFNIACTPFLLRNLVYYFIAGKWFSGFMDLHLPQGYLKKSYEEVWAHCGKDLCRVSQNRFRQYGDISIWLVRYWQIASGQFSPINPNIDGRFFSLNKDHLMEIGNCIRNQTESIVCLNDKEKDHFEESRDYLIASFNDILPEKSSFEL